MTLLREEDDLDYQVANLAEDIANDPRVKEVMASYMFECMMGTYGSIEEEMRKTQNLIKELSMRPRVLLTLQDKDQPKRDSISYLPEFVTDRSFGTCPKDLEKKLGSLR